MDLLAQASVAAAADVEVEQPPAVAGIAATAPGGSTLEEQSSVGSADICGSHDRPAGGLIDGGGGSRFESGDQHSLGNMGGVARPAPAEAQATSLKAAAMLLDGAPSYDDDDEGVDTDDDDDVGHKNLSATEGPTGHQEQQGQQQQGQQQQRQSKHVSLRKSCECCSKKKIKCSRDLPCNQCVKRGLICEYALRKRLNSTVRFSLSLD